MTEDYTHLRGLVLHAANQDRAGADMDLDAENDAAFLDELSGPELGDMLSEAERLIRAARFVKARVEESLLRNVQMDGRIRLGDYGYYSGTESTRRMIDPEGLVDFLFDMGGLSAVKKVIRIESDAKNVRVQALDGIASANGVDPATIRGQFFDEQKGLPALGKAYVGKTKWVQKLGEGERA